MRGWMPDGYDAWVQIDRAKKMSEAEHSVLTACHGLTSGLVLLVLSGSSHALGVGLVQRVMADFPASIHAQDS